MKFTLPASLLAAFSVFFSAPVTAAEPVELARPGEADYSQAAATAQPLFDALERGDIDGALESAFAGHPMAENFRPQLPQLKGQMQIMFDTYGPITRCEAVSRENVGSMVIRFDYQCQHERYATSWNILMLETGRGWIIGSMNFEDAK